MTGAKVLRRIASWLLFLAAATWFLVETIELATAPYLAAYDGEITDLFTRFYLPLLYVVLCLGVMFTTQFALFHHPESNTGYMGGIVLMVFFGVGFGVSLYALIRGMISVPYNAYCTNPSFLYCAVLPAMSIFFGEFVYGFVLYWQDHKAKKKREVIEEAKEKAAKEEVDGVHLNKED